MMILLRSNNSLSHFYPDLGGDGGGGGGKKISCAGGEGGLHSPPLRKIE